MNQADDLISVLTEEHRDQRVLLAELKQLTGNEPLRRSLTDLLIAEMVRHALAEDLYLYPIVTQRLPEWQQVADRYIGEHERLEQTLKIVERHDLTSAEFGVLLTRLDADVRSHTQSEEEQLFPLLAGHLSQDELMFLGRMAIEAKQKAFIPQCHAEPDSPLLIRIVASGTGMVERVRAYLRDLIYPI